MFRAYLISNQGNRQGLCPPVSIQNRVQKVYCGERMEALMKEWVTLKESEGETRGQRMIGINGERGKRYGVQDIGRYSGVHQEDAV